MGTIRVIDEDEDLVEAYRQVLARHGHKAQAVHSAEQAREIHQEFSDLPIIMITAIHHAMDSSFRFPADETWLPVATFQDKPVDPAVLAEKVNAVLGE